MMPYLPSLQITRNLVYYFRRHIYLAVILTNAMVFDILSAKKDRHNTSIHTTFRVKKVYRKIMSELNGKFDLKKHILREPFRVIKQTVLLIRHYTTPIVCVSGTLIQTQTKS